MKWDDLLGHSQQQAWFRTALANGRFATSFLFVGPDGIGKKAFSKLLAQSLLCRETDGAELTFCGSCEDCIQVAAETHPDLIQVCKPSERAFLPIELLIGEREKRMRAGLCHEISMRPYGGRRKIAILDDADTLNQEGANCLLKTLEEPPTDSILILIGTSLMRQLPTIRSRCQTILFRPLSNEHMSILLLKEQIVDSEQQANELARQSGGSLAEAKLVADSELHEFRGQLLEMLSSEQIPIVELAKKCAGIVDSVGKDARAKRERMKLLFRISASFYRTLSIQERRHPTTPGAEGESRPPAEMENGPEQQAVESALKRWRHGWAGSTDCWNRCLVAMEQVDRNANQASLLETWSSDLARLSGC